MKKVEYNYKISVIVPIYNVGKYLEETIKSVVNQSIGFYNIQLILVNDGSTDNSEEICLKYKEKYPNSILYIKKENGGVSVARNTALKAATGKYILFLDGDDIISKKACKLAYKFFEKNYNKIDMISLTLVNMSTGKKAGKYRNVFTKKKDIYNIDNDFLVIQSGINAMIKNGLNIYFDTNLKFGEDEKFMTEILLNKRNIGYCSDAIYYYRDIRLNSSNLVYKEDFTVLSSYYDNYNYMFEKYNYDNYVKKILVNNLIWRLNNNILFNNSIDENNEIHLKISKLLKNVEDEFIIKCMNSFKYYGAMIFKLKYYKNDIPKSLSSYSLLSSIHISNFKKNKEFLLEGCFDTTYKNYEKNVKLYCEIIKKGNVVENFIKLKKIKDGHKLSYNIYSDMKFSLNIKDDFKLIKFYTLIDNKKSYLKVMKDNTLKYYKVDGLRVKYLINDEFINDNIFIFVLKRIYNKIR